jgi:DNA-binding GntR family transcriptional regulator
MGIESKDIDIEVFGIVPARLRELLAGLGEPYDKGASFGVIGMRHTDIDVAMPRRESRAGNKHTDFDVSVDPSMSPREASVRRDFTVNAMMLDPLSDEILDFWGGKADLERRVIRHVSDATFADDALRVFRAAQFAARLNAAVAPETISLCRGIDVTFLSRERVYEELRGQLLTRQHPPGTKLSLHQLAAELGVSRSPVHHALTRLVAEGLLSVLPRRGYYVSPVTARAAAEGYDVRLALELMAAERTVGHVAPEQLERFDDLLERTAAAISHEEWDTANAAFHEHQVNMAGNALLSNVYRELSVNLLMQVIRGGRLEGHSDLVTEHRHIVEAGEVVRRNGDQGAHAPRGHQHTDDAAAQCEHERFGQELTHEAATLGAKRAPCGQLPVASRRLREEQVHHVRTRDEQQESHRSEQDQQRRTRVAGEGLPERNCGHVDHHGVRAVLVLQTCSDSRELRPDLRE